MKRLLLCFSAAMSMSFLAQSQSGCTTTNATGCNCPPDSTATECDLLPDIKVSVDALQSSITVYTQTGNAASGSQGSNDGRLRFTGTTPNMGWGPLETRSINKWLCGTDTLLANPGALCPDGSVPRRFVVQRIYHKNGNVMSYTDVPCGTMTYHSSHGHMHVDNWGRYTLRLQNPADPNPLNWSIVGNGTKLAFCLLDINSCTNGPNYCRDDNNNPRTTASIPNYAIGNGSYGCSSTLQGISNGYYDAYSSGLDGMWIDIPTGTCNGTYYVVMQVDPNQNMVELNENNNVIAVPVTLTNQAAPGSPVANIFANKPGTLIPGTDITLNATAGSSYSWSSGQTTQSITVSSSGSYTVTVTNYCGTATSNPFVVNVLPPANSPVTSGASICSGSTAALSATNGGTGTMKWYNSSASTIPLTTGITYTTPPLTSTTTYYVENEVTTTGATSHVGPVDKNIGSGSYLTTAPTNAWYLQFDAVSDMTLNSVNVYSSTTGNRTFILQDRASTQLKTFTVNITSTSTTVPTVINLNWFIPTGPGYKLLVSGTPNLYYNTSGVSYPYLVSGLCMITGSYSGHANYPFFYDLVVKSPDLVAKSGMVPVTATVTSSITVGASATESTICQGGSTTLNATGASGYTWNPGGMSGSSVVVSPGTTTTYTVTGTSGGCTDTETIFITVNTLPTASGTITNSTCGAPNGAIDITPSGGTGPYTYQWSPGGASSQDLSGVSPGNYTVVVTDANSCIGSQTFSIGSGGVAPSAPSIVNGKQIICKGSLGIPYSVPVISGATSYTWTPPAGATIATGQGTNSVTLDFSASQASGSICVYATNSCGNSAPTCQILTITTVKPSVPASISGPTTVCAGSTGIAFSCPSISNAETFNWTMPTGATIASGAGTNSITVNFSASYSRGYIRVSATNCIGTSSNRSVYLYGIPTTPTAITGQINEVCAGTSGVPYSISPVAAATLYTWTPPLNATIATGQGSTSVTLNFNGSFTSGTLRVTAGNVCGNSGSRSATVRSVPVAPGVMSGPSTVCANQTGVAYSCPAVTGATTYSWTVPNGATIVSGQGTTAIVVNFGASSGSVKAKAGNACGLSTARSLSVAINCRTVEAVSELTVFPNPAHDLITVTFHSTVNDHYVTRISDIIGRIVYTGTHTSFTGINKLDIDLEDYVRGVYTLSIEMSHSSQVRKIVVE